MPMVSRARRARETSQVVLAGIISRRQTRSGRHRGRPRAGEASARARQHETPGRFAAATPHLRVRARADSIDEGGGLVAAPWERRRTRRDPGVANGRVEHPTRAAPAGGRGRAADAISTTGPTRRARTHVRAVTAHAAPTACVARAPQVNRKERARWRGCFDPPQVHVRIVVRRSLVLGTTPGTSFAGVHGSEGGHSARRDARRQGRPSLDEVSTVHGRRQTVQSRRRKVSSCWGEVSRVKIRHARLRLTPSNRGVRPGSHHRARRGCAPEERASPRGVGAGRVRGSKGLAQGLPASTRRRGLARPLTARRCRHAARESVHPKSPA